MKSSTKTLGLIAILGIAGYFVYKYLSGGNGFSIGGGGGGGGGTTITTTTIEETTTPYFIRRTPQEYQDIHNAAGQRQTWIGGTYGSPGQPSEAFKQNTLKALPSITGIGKVTPTVTVSGLTKTVTISKPLAIIKGAKPVVVMSKTIAQQRASLAASAIKANAPPRVVAKIKAGKWY